MWGLIGRRHALLPRSTSWCFWIFCFIAGLLNEAPAYILIVLGHADCSLYCLLALFRKAFHDGTTSPYIHADLKTIGEIIYFRAMFPKWLFGSFLLVERLFVLVASLQSPLQDLSSADESLTTMEDSNYPPSSSIPSLPSCSLDLVNLKEVDYNTIFDGGYGSKFENAILTLCSDEGKHIPWKKTNTLEPWILDQVAERCCSDLIHGLETVSLDKVNSVGLYSPWTLFFVSASVSCLLFIIKAVYEH